MTKQRIATKSLNTENNSVAITFSNDRILLTGLDDMPAEMVTRLALHGLTQKVGDSYSGESDPTQAYLKAANTVEMLESGGWSIGRAGNGGVLAEALARQSGRDLEECQEVIKGLDDKMKGELRKALKVELATIALEKANKAAANAPANDGLQDLGGLFD